MCSYQLSSEIFGHSADVRAVAVVPSCNSTTHRLLTASRDGTACIWESNVGSKEYILKKAIRSHTGYVSSLCVIPTATGREKRESNVASYIVHVVHSVRDRSAKFIAGYIVLQF